MTGRACATATAIALSTAGCGLSNPNAPAPVRPSVAPTGLRTPTDVVDAQRHEPVRVAVDYTLTQATWSADTWTTQHARLGELATGRALAQLAPRDGQPPAAILAQLQAAGASSQATLIGTDRPRRDQVVVAYKQRATGAGRSSRPDYQIAHLTLTRRGRSWRVATFQIQP